MVNSRSGVYTSGLKMVCTKQITNHKCDVSLNVSLLRVNIHGVHMHDPSSSSSKQPRMATRTSVRVVSENHPTDTLVSESPLHGFDPIKVMPLAMVPLVDPSTQISFPIVPTVDRNLLVDETLFVRLDNCEFEYVFSVDHCVCNVTVGSVPISKSTSLIDENMFDKSEIVGSTYGMVDNISPVVCYGR